MSLMLLGRSKSSPRRCVEELPNAPVLLRAIYYQAALESFSYGLARRSTKRLSRARLQQLPLDGEVRNSIQVPLPMSQLTRMGNTARCTLRLNCGKCGVENVQNVAECRE